MSGLFFALFICCRPAQLLLFVFENWIKKPIKGKIGLGRYLIDVSHDFVTVNGHTQNDQIRGSRQGCPHWGEHIPNVESPSFASRVYVMLC